MLVIYHDSVLIKISVRRKLPEPLLAAEGYVNGAERAFAAPGKALVFVANIALGITALGFVSLRGFFCVAEFRLSLVYGNDKPVFLETRVFIEFFFFYIVVLYGIILKPFRSGFRA